MSSDLTEAIHDIFVHITLSQVSSDQTLFIQINFKYYYELILGMEIIFFTVNRYYCSQFHSHISNECIQFFFRFVPAGKGQFDFNFYCQCTVIL